MPTLEAEQGTDNNAEQARRDADNGQRYTDASRQQLEQATRTGEEALGQLVEAWANAFRAFVPTAWLDPRQALRFAFDYSQQNLTLQRRLWEQVLDVTAENTRIAYDQQRENGSRNRV